MRHILLENTCQPWAPVDSDTKLQQNYLKQIKSIFAYYLFLHSMTFTLNKTNNLKMPAAFHGRKCYLTVYVIDIVCISVF